MHVCTCAPPTKHRPRLDIRPSLIGCAAKMVTDACSEEHNQQLADLLRFLRRKRDAAIAEVAAEFNDTKESRLFEESYHVDDVTAILDGLLSVVRTAMKRDLQRSAFSSVLLLKQVFEQVEEKGLGLTTDLPTTEDRRLLEVVERWDQDVHGGSSSAPPPLRARAVMATRPTNRPLASIGQSQDPKLLSDLQNMTDDNATLQERFNRLQLQCSAALREKSAMQQQLDAAGLGGAAGGASDSMEVADLRAQVAQLQDELQHAHRGGGGGGGSGVDTLMRELNGMQENNAQLAAELDASRAEATARVERSTQFVNLRQMLAKKNLLVRQLRETLQANGIYVDDVDAVDE